jgi:hypothetical protein
LRRSARRYGLVDHRAVLDSVAIVVIASWEHLAKVIELQRTSIHPRMWENFEYLYRLAKSWFVERGGQERLDAWIADVRGVRRASDLRGLADRLHTVR